jgi:hypothetical protein
MLIDTPMPTWADEAAEMASSTNANNNERIDKIKRMVVLSA